MVVAFAGIFLWAYSSRRKDDFADAANLPLEDDESVGTGIHSETKIPQNNQQGAQDS